MTNESQDNTENQIHTLDEIADNVSVKSDDEINRLIAETQETLNALIDELEHRKTTQQHEDVDHLEEYLNNANSSFKALHEFIAIALKEIRSKK